VFWSEHPNRAEETAIPIAIFATAFGGPEVLEARHVDVPPPRSGEVALEVRAAGVNPVDMKSYAGEEKGHDESKLPLALGVEASGVVTAVGEGAVGPGGPIRIGDHVIAYRILGGYASALIAPASTIINKPADVLWETAAAMMLSGTTAVHLLTATGVTDGDTVLVHGAAGGVGSLVAQIAVRDGAIVVGTSAPKDFERLRRYGITPIAYGSGLLDRVHEAAPQGIDAAIDTVGTDEAIDVSIAVVPGRRRIATVVAFNRAKELGIKALGGSPGSDRGGIEIRNGARHRLISLLTEGSIDIVIGGEFPLAQAADAHRLLAAGGLPGKAVLIP
jgi:NADPH2:quinone reductase